MTTARWISGFAITTWNNSTSPRDNTCQSLGLIFPCNKVPRIWSSWTISSRISQQNTHIKLESPKSLSPSCKQNITNPGIPRDFPEKNMSAKNIYTHWIPVELGTCKSTWIPLILMICCMCLVIVLGGGFNPFEKYEESSHLKPPPIVGITIPRLDTRKLERRILSVSPSHLLHTSSGSVVIDHRIGVLPKEIPGVLGYIKIRDPYVYGCFQK